MTINSEHIKAIKDFARIEKAIVEISNLPDPPFRRGTWEGSDQTYPEKMIRPRGNIAGPTINFIVRVLNERWKDIHKIILEFAQEKQIELGDEVKKYMQEMSKKLDKIKGEDDPPGRRVRT